MSFVSHCRTIAVFVCCQKFSAFNFHCLPGSPFLQLQLEGNASYTVHSGPLQMLYNCTSQLHVVEQHHLFYSNIICVCDFNWTWLGNNLHSKIQTLLTIKTPLSLNEIYSLGDQLKIGSDGDLKEDDFAKQTEEVKIDLVFPVTLQFHNRK